MVAVSLLQALLLTQAFNRASGDLDTISNGSIPSVDAAQATAQYIEDIDAKAADYLATAALTDLQPCSIVGTNKPPVMLTVHDCDNLNINAEIILANPELYNAAHNVTYPGERTAVERITASFEEYTGDIAVVRHEYELAIAKNDPLDCSFLQ